MDDSAYEHGVPLTSDGTFELVTDEAYRDGVIEPGEEKLLKLLASALRIPRDRARVLSRRSKERFRKGQLGPRRRFDSRLLYARVMRYALSDGRVDVFEKAIVRGLFRIFKLTPEDHAEILAEVQRDRDSTQNVMPARPRAPEPAPVPPPPPPRPATSSAPGFILFAALLGVIVAVNLAVMFVTREEEPLDEADHFALAVGRSMQASPAAASPATRNATATPAPSPTPSPSPEPSPTPSPTPEPPPRPSPTSEPSPTPAAAREPSPEEAYQRLLALPAAERMNADHHILLARASQLTSRAEAAATALVTFVPLASEPPELAPVRKWLEEAGAAAKKQAQDHLKARDGAQADARYRLALLCDPGMVAHGDAALEKLVRRRLASAEKSAGRTADDEFRDGYLLYLLGDLESATKVLRDLAARETDAYRAWRARLWADFAGRELDSDSQAVAREAAEHQSRVSRAASETPVPTPVPVTPVYTPWQPKHTPTPAPTRTPRRQYKFYIDPATGKRYTQEVWE